MKLIQKALKIGVLFFVGLFMSNCEPDPDLEQPQLTGPTIFDGPALSFVRADNADFTLPENQDFITENVIITRGNTMGIFNIAQEGSFASGNSNSISPAGTEWAIGSTSGDLESLEFTTWSEAVGDPQEAVINVTNFVMHLIEEDIFINVIFTSFSGGNTGGGFSYNRSTASE